MYGGTSGTGSDGFLLTLNYNAEQIIPGGTTIPQMGVFMKGEIFTLNSFTLPASPSGSNNFINIVIESGYTNTAPGLKVLQNGTSINTYETRIANRINTNSGGGGGFEGQFQAFEWVATAPVIGWKILNNANYKYLQNQKTGLNSAFINITTNTTNIATNANNIVSHENRLDDIDAPWTTVSGLGITNCFNWLFQDGSVSSPVVFPSPIGTFDSGSFFKFKKIGNTMFFNFNILNMYFPKPNSAGSPSSSTVVAGVIMDFSTVGISTINANISGTLHASERIMESPISNVAFIKRYNQYGILILLNNLGSESTGAWNYNYYLAPTTASSSIATRNGSGFPYITLNTRWSLRGSFQIELD